MMPPPLCQGLGLSNKPDTPEDNVLGGVSLFGPFERDVWAPAVVSRALLDLDGPMR